jgi:hypothetical protein
MSSGVSQPKASTSPLGADLAADLSQASRLGLENSGHGLFVVLLIISPPKHLIG